MCGGVGWWKGFGCGEVGTVPEHQMKTQQKGTEEAGKPGPEVTEVRGRGGGGDGSPLCKER